MRGKGPDSLERYVASLRKKFRRSFSRRENSGDCGLFDAAITPSSGQFRWEGIVERILSRGEIDRRSIVGIDQAEIPIFGALIDVGHAGCGKLDQSLGQAIGSAGCRNTVRKGGNLVQ
jgi:hypothetical protein